MQARTAGTGTRPGSGMDSMGQDGLLAWWALAGVDTAVRETPVSWLAPRPAATPPVADTVAPRHRAFAAASPNPSGERWDDCPDLASLLARVRDAWAGCPIADGNPRSGLVIVGDAPSADDLRSGRPFSGPAGQLLDRMLAAIGLDRSDCYITLIAPRQRLAGPAPAHAIAADRALTATHLRLARPRLLLLLGQSAATEIGGATGAIGAIRGQWLQAPGLDAPALPTFNPAYLLRRPEEKAKAWADLLALRTRMRS